MNEQSPKKINGHWQFIVDGWPVISAIVGVSWVISLVLADNYVTGIHEREYAKTIVTEPLITSIRNDITAIEGSLSNLEGNDNEIRGQLATVIQRLDTLIEIQLQGQ
jgi:hypothetical protein